MMGKKYPPLAFSGYLSNNARVGLENLGNTCYLNSILQALFMTKVFCYEILTTQRADRMLLELQKLFALMLFSPRHEQNPSSVINAIRPDDFLPGIQHDSSEFLGSLLDRLHENEQKRLKADHDNNDDGDDRNGINCESTSFNIADEERAVVMNEETKEKEKENTAKVEEEEDCDAEPMRKRASSDIRKVVATQVVPMNCESENDEFSKPKDKILDNTVNTSATYIHKIFGGKICTRYLCSSCNSNSIHVDSFRDLQLSFPEKSDDSNTEPFNVQQLLEFYFQSEELSMVGDNQYYCETCKVLCNGLRVTEILEAPKNLILTLKHFCYDSRYHTRSKLLYKVFHDEIINVNVNGSFSSHNGARNVEYKLYAAVVHTGTSLDSGHYYTIARENEHDWFQFNDSYVTRSSLNELRR
jgi:ubiquitin carboxyl-terminal hydrolase 35/38